MLIYCGRNMVKIISGQSPVFIVGGKYNWKGQPERLVYLGYNWSGSGYWHQFKKIDDPRPVWCEVQGYELQYFEESK